MNEIQFNCFHDTGSIFIWAYEDAEYETLISIAKKQLADKGITSSSYQFHKA